MTSYTVTNSDTHVAIDSMEVVTNPALIRGNIEPGSTSDSVVRQVIAIRAITESPSSPSEVPLVPSDNLYPSDDLYPGYVDNGGDYSTGDSVQRWVSHLRTTVEELTVADTLGRQFSSYPYIVETLDLTDALAASQGFKPRLSVETLTPTQITTRRYNAHRSSAQTLTLIQTSARRYGAKRLNIETTIGADQLARHIIRGRTFVETHVATATLLHHYTAIRSPVEAHTASDAVSHHETAHRALSEALEASQATTRRHGALRSSVETFTPVQVLTTNRHEARSISETHSVSDAVAEISHHNHAQRVYEFLTTTDEPFLRFLLPVEGYVNYNAATGLTTSDLPDWGYVLIEGTNNALYWAPLARFEFDPYREK